jgi:predicted  nucleic acid-binding Zn-ribbon protein
MKKTIYNSLSILAALLFVVSSTVVAQQSDYQIQQDFRADYSELVNRVDNAVSSEDLEGLNADIDALEADYSEYSSIIDAAIYPDTFSERMDDLRSRYAASDQNITVIEELNERIRGLMEDLDQFRGQMTELDEEQADLKEQLDRSSANERRQAALIRQYRQNLEQRDAFVTEFLENLMTKYQSMDSSTQSEIADAAERMEDNPVEVLKTIISEYTNTADQGSDLSSADYLGMRAQHGYFADVWDRIGDQLTNTFAPDSPVQERQEVSDMLAAWQASIDNKLWNALSTSFNQNGIELDSFTGSDAFFDALGVYVRNASQAAVESNSEEDYETYRNFANYWNSTVKGQWGEVLVQGDVLSPSQMAEIDVELGTWGENAPPTSNLMFILFLISLAVIIGLVVLLVTKKS